MMYDNFVRRKVFISYHHADQAAVERFVDRWCDQENVFIPRALGVSDYDDFINSSNPEYVMQRVRELYLGDSTVTLLLMGECTHSRRYVDWELKSSLRQGEYYIPNGLLAIKLPGTPDKLILPERFRANRSSRSDESYAQYWDHPQSAVDLRAMIEDAFAARSSKSHLIQNSQDMMRYNGKCQVHGFTH